MDPGAATNRRHGWQTTDHMDGPLGDEKEVVYFSFFRSFFQNFSRTSSYKSLRNEGLRARPIDNERAYVSV